MSPDHDKPTAEAVAASSASAAAAQAAEPVVIEPEPAPEAPAEPVAESAHTPSEADAAATAAEAAADLSSAPEAQADLAQLIEQYSTPPPHEPSAREEAEIVEGRVAGITEQGVVVDIGAKSEGLIPAQEFLEDGGPKLEREQTIPVQLTGEEKDGYIILSYQRARRRRAWENIEKSYRERIALTGTVVDRIKGGLVVDIGVRAFLPASQADVRPVHDLDAWKGREVALRVLKMNRKRGNVVVSCRAVLEEKLQSQRQKLLDVLAEGQVLTGKVKNITDYGVFIDLGGMDGLLHITDLSWIRLKHPSEAVSVGQEIEVQVLRFDREKMRVSLGRKQLLPDPWADVPAKFPAGARVSGRVVGITDYGAFIELAPGVEGLVHISEMTWSKRLKHPSKIVTLGDTVEAVVLDLKPEQRRISLGLKQTTLDPWQELAAKYPVGAVVTGRVRNLTDFGAFVEIEDGFDGLIHVSDISWTEKIRNPAEKFKKGDTLEARVLKIDAANRRVSLGIKQVNDIWADWFRSHKVNDLVRGRVARITSFGAFVELAQGIEGLCHISEIEDRRRREKDGGQAPRSMPAGAGKPASALETGKEYDFKVIKLQPDQHKIGLSYRAAAKAAERRDMEEYRSSKSSATATIGDAILSKRESS